MKINREAFVEAISAALKAERDGSEKINAGIGFYIEGNEIVSRYESELSPTDRIHFLRWDARGFGINDRVADMTDDQIREDAAASFEIFGDEILDEILDVLVDEEY